MKITSSLAKLFFTCTIYFCCVTIIFSQEKKTLLNGCLWLKGVEYKTENYTTPVNEEELALRKYFNYNPCIDFSKDEILKKYKNLITKSSSLFVVFKSSSREETILLSMERGSFKATLSNKKMLCDKDVILNKGNSTSGIIVSYLFNKNSLNGKKNGNLLFEDLLFEDTEFKNQLLELICIPKFINDKEKSIIESYLSLKYGISLNEGQSYYNSKGDKIWDVKENEGFNFNITGIGKDDYLGLNQKQSKNSLQGGLSIGLKKVMKKNIENETIIKDKEYLIWGDNGKNVVLEKNSDGTQKRMKRIWKIKPISDSISKFTTQLKIDKKLMPIEVKFDINDPEFIWLAVDNSNMSEFNYTDAKYIKATINNEN
ncbi:MAG: hypothetical protein K2P85_02965, partial [Flavobacteriaceae bacterium]|nr:hypothetical protein [Flavobacteriaceae bacterium]